MKMIAENAETIRIDGYSTFIVGFDDVTVEAFASAINAAFANKNPSSIYDMLSFVGNATEDTNAAIEQGYLTEANRIDEIISLISQFGKFDDSSEKKFEKTLDSATNTAIMGTRKANKYSDQPRSSTMNVKKTLNTVVVWYNPTTQKVSLAKCRTTGKFISLSVAQGLLNVELKAFRLPCTSTLKVEYSFIQTLVIVMLTLILTGLSALAGVAIAEGLLLEAVIIASAVLGMGMLWIEASEDHLKVSTV